MNSQVAIVTGGTRGIGLAISRALGEAGASVIMVYRENEETAELALSHMAGTDGSLYRADVRNPNEMRKMVKTIGELYGPVNTLVHSAFRSGRTPQKVHELEVSAFMEDIETNLTGAFIASRACLPTMIAQKWGRIIFIGSLAMRGERGRVAYSVAKNGVVGLCKTIAQEYARTGITANVVSPGYIDAGAFVTLDDKIKAAAAKQVPQGRLGQAEEIAKAVCYFASEDSGYTTGQVLNVNGGVFTG